MKQKRVLTETDVSHVKVGRRIFPGITRSFSIYSPEGLTKKFTHYRVGKVYWKKETGVKPRTVFLRPINKHGVRDAKESISIAHELRKLGLPVPHQGLVSKEGAFSTKYYIATEAFFKKGNHSKIQPLNRPFFGILPHGYPNRLSRMSIKKDAYFIKELARCTAKIANAGFEIGGMEVFGFYKKKDGKLGVVIHDLENIQRVDYGSDPTVYAAIGVKLVYTDAATVWSPIRSFLGLKEKDARLNLFWETLRDNLDERIKRLVDPPERTYIREFG
ncbi:Uncharacterised protein [uncultured archaeon]|nr:Uncharacterised protein [uncultured archaeon]